MTVILPCALARLRILASPPWFIRLKLQAEPMYTISAFSTAFSGRSLSSTSSKIVTSDRKCLSPFSSISAKLDAVAWTGSVTTCETSIPSFLHWSRTNLPFRSSPTRPAMVTGMPRRDNAIAVLRASPPQACIGFSIMVQSLLKASRSTGLNKVSHTIIPKLSTTF